MIGVMMGVLHMSRPDPVTGRRMGFSEWFSHVTHMQQADQNAQIVGEKLRADDQRFERNHGALDRKMEQQRAQMEKTQDRIRSAQDRNEAQQRKLDAQMERMKYR